MGKKFNAVKAGVTVPVALGYCGGKAVVGQVKRPVKYVGECYAGMKMYYDDKSEAKANKK